MNRITKSTLAAAVLAALAGGLLAACGAKESHDGHDHPPGETHADHK